MKKNYKKNEGFTLLVAIVVTSMLLLVSFVVVNVALKQLVISYSNQESQYAFYNADSGTECAVYWDLKNPGGSGSAFSPDTASTINCNSQSISSGQSVTGSQTPTASIVGGGGVANPISIFSVNLPRGCAIVKVDKSVAGVTTINSYGYNTCDITAARRFERGITLTYDTTSSSSSSLACNQMVGSVATDPTLSPWDVQVSGNYAYVTNYDDLTNFSSFQIFDISDPTAPVLRSTLTGVGFLVQSLVAVDNYVYIADRGENAIKVINVALPANPTVVATLSGISSPKGMAVIGNYLYASSISGPIKVIDITNRAAPVYVGDIGGGGGEDSVFAAGGYLYGASHFYSTLIIFDTSNPAAPVYKGFLGASDGLSGPEDAVADPSRKLLFVNNTAANNIKIYDVTNPTGSMPQVGSAISTGATSRFLDIGGNYIYTTIGSSNILKKIDVSNPNSIPTPLDISIDAGPKGLFVSGAFVYVAARGGKMLDIVHVCP